MSFFLDQCVYLLHKGFVLFCHYSSCKCLNLNSIMPEVLGLDDMDWLTLHYNSYKCLNLNSIMPEVLEPDDMDWLTHYYSFYKC